ncbi:UDP-glucose 4-epimerase GalE [bacterium SCSIO 12696]|nr:UDP-glucose 4-epimerase GalE [bacterium SCSIO 12696]
MKVLVTGGLGYIGSHTCVQMHQAGMEPVILDNGRNSHPVVLDRIEAITGLRPVLYKGDVRDAAILDQIFAEHQIDAVIHFAGLKAVGESVEKPLAYYDNNVNGSLVLADAMKRAGVKTLVFSSSATVYGDPQTVPVLETAPVGATTNPYATSKLMVEQCLRDLQQAEPEWSIIVLRYFNPVGAHISGTMGEDPQGIPNNLMPYISQVAVGRREELPVFGDDYPTVDGTGVRDYIHVVDLADGHIAALRCISRQAGYHIYNLGTGKGSSVLQMIDSFSKACGRPINYRICPRRPGDVAEYWADPSKAIEELNWQPSRTLDDMTADTWRWQSQNPNGYAS